MNYRALLLMAALAPLEGQINSTSTVAKAPEVVSRPATSVTIPRATFNGLERRFDGGLQKVGEPDFPIDLLGNTRGVYLEGYGAVFTTEMSLVMTPGPNPFMMTIPKELVVRTHQRKLERLPLLRKTLQEFMKIAGQNLASLPQDQQIVMVVRLDYRQWEDTSGLPGQILMRTDRKSAILGEITTVQEQ